MCLISFTFQHGCEVPHAVPIAQVVKPVTSSGTVGDISVGHFDPVTQQDYADDYSELIGRAAADPIFAKRDNIQRMRSHTCFQK